MKVPTYTSKLQRTKTAGGGALLNASMSLAAAAAPGKSLESVGDQVFNLGYEKYKIQATSEINETMPYFTAEIEGIKEKYKNSHNPVEAEKKVKSEMQKVYKKYISGKFTNAGGNPFLSSNLARSGFNTKANNLITQGLLNWKKENNKYIVALNKTNHLNEVNKNDKIAGNINLNKDQRLKGFENNFKIFPGAKKYAPLVQATFDGKYNYLSNNNILSAKEIKAQTENSLNNIGFSITNSIIGSQKYSPMMVSETLFTGDVEKIKTVDPILAKVWEKMDGEQRTDFLKKVRTEEKAFYDDLKARNEITEKNNNKENEGIYKSIVNVDLNDENKVKEAKEKFALLQSRGFFAKPSQRTAIEKLLNPSEEDKARTTDMDAWKQLTLLAQKNQLTLTAITDKVELLSLSDFKHFINELEKERNDADKKVNDEINRSFYADKFTANDTNLAQRFNAMRINTIIAFDNWRSQNPTATYAMIEAEGKRLLQERKDEIAELFKVSFDGLVNSFRKIYSSKFEAVKGYKKKYTLRNIQNFLMKSLVASRDNVAEKSYAEQFTIFNGIPGSDLWNQ
tara:strand:- start:3995 stop:5695 length:1701 start_codon:yes stop_codon:yes gene_type:complete